VGDDEMEWHHFPRGLEPEVLSADLCSAYGVRCWALGGEEICPGRRKYDPAVMTGGEIDHTFLHLRVP
jgi:hypothetical protein